MIIDAFRHAGLVPSITESDTSSEAVEITLNHMQEAGIGRSVLLPVAGPNYLRSNQQVAALSKRYPGKFIAFARHHPAKERDLTTVIRKEVETLGIMGLMVTSQPTRKQLEVVAELRWPVLYEHDVLVELHMAAQEFPQVPFIVTGLGSDTREFVANYLAIDLARRYPNVYLAPSALSLSEYLEAAIKKLGPAKLIFASDGPERDSRVELHRVRLLKLTREEEAMVLGRNFERMLPR